MKLTCIPPQTSRRTTPARECRWGSPCTQPPPAWAYSVSTLSSRVSVALYIWMKINYLIHRVNSSKRRNRNICISCSSDIAWMTAPALKTSKALKKAWFTKTPTLYCDKPQEKNHERIPCQLYLWVYLPLICSSSKPKANS